MSELVVVGAGPAGLAASLAAADLGVAVTLVDAERRPGGQIHRQSDLDPPGSPQRLPRRLGRVAGHPRIRHLAAATVWHAEPAEGGFRLAVDRDDAPPLELHARAVVLATGAAELVLPFPGWTLPGVTTAGAAQALLKGQGTAIGRRVVVAGSGPFLLPVAATLADAGVTVAAVLEATRPTVAAAALAAHPAKLREAAGYAARLARRRVPVRAGWAVIAAHGDGQVERATIARVDRDWRAIPGSRRELTVDAVCAGFGFVPALELPRSLGCRDVAHPDRPLATVWHDADQATSQPGVFAAGEATGVGGADVATLEGDIAGVAAAGHLGHVTPGAAAARTRPVRARLARARRFAALLERLYPLRAGWCTWPAADTVICRCEETPWAAVRDAVAAGADDVRSVKGVTRCGMGYCQGRMCGPPLQHAVALASGRSLAAVGDLHTRIIGAPVPLERVARTLGHAADHPRGASGT